MILKKFNSIREAQDDYAKKQLGTGSPLERPGAGQGRNSDAYEVKKQRKPVVEQKKSGGY